MTIEIFKDWKDRIEFDQLKLFEVFNNPNKTDAEKAEIWAEYQQTKQVKTKLEKKIRELQTA